MANLRQDQNGESYSLWAHPPHVAYLDNLLLQLANGDLLDLGFVGLIIEEPPRHGKSELTSHYFPSWFLGTFPDKRVMLASYEADFAATWGRKARDTVEAFGPDIFGVGVHQGSSARDDWNLKGHKGGMMTSGVGGKFTGRGADLLIADDLIKNYADAQSELLRDKTWAWWRSTARTRLEPGGVICVIGTRWHEDDLIGRLLAMQGDSAEGKMHELYDDDADKYLRVRLPAFAEGPEDIEDGEEYVPDPLGREPGEALWPERYGVKALRTLKATLRYQFTAMFQQRPTPIEGAVFQRDWFEIVPTPKEKLRIVRRWDLAATEEGEADDPDWTAGVKVGLSDEGIFYVLDVQHFRETPGRNEKNILRTAIADGQRVKIRMEQEPGASGKSMVSHYRRRVLRNFMFRGVRTTGDKNSYIEKAAAFAENKDIKLVRAPWNKVFLREVTRWPNGAHDDILDAFSKAIDDLTSRKYGQVATW